MKNILIAIIALTPFLLTAQNERTTGLDKKIKSMEIKPVVLLQFWGTYSMGQEVYDQNTGQYQAIDDRLNFQLRRSRIGIKGSLAPRVKFNFTSAYDLVGRDLLAATQAGANNGSSPSLRLWNAYVQWQIKDNSQAWNLTAGYFTPRIGRESINSPFRSGSMEKAWSQNYLRRHVVGIGPGRATGVNLGGLLTKDHKLGWGYDVGVFTPNFTSLSGNSSGKQASPLAVGRLAFYIGDDEGGVYKLGHKANHKNKRRGLTIGLSGSAQGATDLFDANYTTGIDWMFNFDGLNFDGDLSLMQRKGHMDIENKSFTSEGKTGYLRLSYNIPVKKYLLEPSVMFVHFQGAETLEGIEAAAMVNDFVGKDQSLELGVNVHLSSNVRCTLHYTMNQGDGGEAEVGDLLNNNFLYQSGVGAIRRGNWVGMGLVINY